MSVSIGRWRSLFLLLLVWLATQGCVPQGVPKTEGKARTSEERLPTVDRLNDLIPYFDNDWHGPVPPMEVPTAIYDSSPRPASALAVLNAPRSLVSDYFFVSRLHKPALAGENLHQDDLFRLGRVVSATLSGDGNRFYFLGTAPAVPSDDVLSLLDRFTHHFESLHIQTEKEVSEATQAKQFDRLMDWCRRNKKSLLMTPNTNGRSNGDVLTVLVDSIPRTDEASQASDF